MKNNIKNHQLFQTVLLALCLFVILPSFSKEKHLLNTSNNSGLHPSSIHTSADKSISIHAIAGPTITIQPSSQPICAGSSVTFSVTATGTGTLNYQWRKNGTPILGETSASLTLTNVSSADNGSLYSCAITDSSDTTISSDATLTVNPNINPGFTQVASICSGATLTALPTNSTNGITGSWSPALNNTATTTYTFTPTAGQCATTATMTITVNPNITPTFSQVAPICYGATLTALPTTSSNGITGSWSPALNNTATTTYTFTPTAGQCATTATMTISVNSLPVISPIGNTSTICLGQSTTLSVSGAASYLWSTGSSSSSITVNPTSNATYSITGTGVNGCIKTETFTVQVNSLPTITISGNSTICNGTSTTLNASGATSYTWSTGSNLNQITVNPSSNTSYTVTGTDSNSCSNTKTINVLVNAIPTASVSATSPICSGNTAFFTITGTPLATVTYTINSGSNVTKVLDNSGVANVTIPGVSTNQTINLVSVVTLSGCQNTSFSTPSATIQVNSIPTPPVTSPLSICQNSASTALTALTSAGGTLNWYNSATGGTGSSSAPITNTTNVVTTNYYVSQTVDGCESARSLLAVTIKSLPASPTVSSSLSYCIGETAPVLSATGSDLKWYTLSSGGTSTSTPSAINTASVSNTNYYVSQTVNGCEGPRSSINVVVNTIPLKPTTTTSITYCQNASASPLGATGSAIKWYTVSSGGTASNTAPTPDTSIAGTTYYYVSQTINGCESARETVEVVVKGTPSIPTVTSPLSICQNSASTALTALVSAGGTLNWYNSATGGTGSSTAPITNTANVVTTNYYVSQTVDGCESVRTLLAITVKALPAAPSVSSSLSYCIGETAPVLTATGSDLKWYNVSSGGTSTSTPSAINTSSASNTNYFVSQTVNGCEGPRSTINVVVNSIPSNPTISSNLITYCQNGSAVPLTATGSSLKWYTTATGGTGSTTAPTPSTVTATTTAYYVSQTVNGCESGRTKIDVLVNPTPLAPSVNSPLTYCQNEIAPALIAPSTSGTLKWYLSSTGNGAFVTPPTPSTSSVGSLNYYVSQTINGCESPRSSIIVNINALPSVSAGLDQTVCAGSTVILAGSGASTYVWNNNVINNTAFIPTATANYNVTVTDTNGCSNSDQVVVTVNPIPTNPTTPTSLITYCQNAIAVPLAASGSSLKWYSAATGGIGATTAPTPNTSIATTTSYYVSQTVNGCESGRTKIDVLVNSSPSAPPVISSLTYCLGEIAPTLSTSTVTGNTLKWYSVSTGGSSLSSIIPSTSNSGVTSYFVSQTNNDNCESPRSEISVTVNTIPLVPVVSPTISYCKGATAIPLNATATSGNTLRWYTVISGGTPLPGVPTPSTATVGDTTYYVSQLSSATGCESARASVVVTVKAIPSIPAFTSSVTLCQFSSAPSLTATASAGGTLNWYSTASGGSGSLIAPTPNTNTANLSSYFVSQTINGCEGPRGTISVTVNPTPVNPTIGSVVNPSCTLPSGSVQLNNLPTGSDIPYGTWTVTKIPGGETYSNATSTYTISNLNSGTYTFTVSNGLCTSSSSAAVTITALPVQAAPVIGTIVQPTCTVATGSITLNNLPSGNWSLTSNTGGIISGSGNSTTISGLVPGTYFYTVKNISSDCISIASSNVVIANQPFTPSAPNITSPQFFVTGAKVGDLVTPSGSIKWYLVPSGGAVLNPLTTLISGNYYASETLGSCESSRFQTLITVDAPTNGGIVNAVGASTICSGSSANLKLTTYVGSVIKWQSSVDNSTWIDIPNTSSIDTYSTPNLTSSLYYRSVVQSGVSSIEYSLPAFITVNAPSNAGTLSPLTSAICKNTTGGTITLNGNNGNVIKWQKSTDGGSVWTDIAGTANSTSYFVPALTMTTLFRAVVQNGVCAQIATTNPATITVKDTPDIPVLTNQLACVGETKSFGTTPQNSAYDYVWTSNRRSLTNNLLSTISILFDQAYQEDITLTISPNDNTNTCVVSGTFTVSTNPLPVASVVANATICEGNSIAIGSNSVTGSTYSWSSTPAGPVLSGSNPLVSPGVSTTYTLVETVTNTGCSKSRGVIVTVQQDPTSAITSGPSVICETETNVLIEATITNDYDAIVWEVVPANAGDLNIINNSKVEFTPTAAGILAGTATVRHTLTNKCGVVQTPVNFPITIQKQSIANAGLAVSTCDTNGIQLNGAGSINATTYAWTKPTNVTGSLTPANSATPTYTPSAADVANYTIPLSFILRTSSGSACTISQASVNVTLIKKPVISAGPANTTICEGSDYIVVGSSKDTNTASFVWKTSGDGQFTNGTTIAPTYTPGVQDKINGTVTITLEATGNFPCTTVTSQTVISITKKPIVNYSDQVVCGDVNTPISISGSIQNAGIIEWITTNGLGSFDDTAIPNPHYTPHVSDMNSTIIFRLRVYNNSGCNTSQYVEKFIEYRINPKPSVSAGLDATICEGLTYTLNSASSSNAVISWSAASGTFNDINQTKPIYTPSPSATSVTLTITGTQPGCTAVTDNMVLTIQKKPQAIADNGLPQVICQGDSFYFNASAPYSSSVLWQIESPGTSGTLNNPTSISASYTSGTNESGTVTFSLTANPLSPGCTTSVPARSVTQITIVPKPTVTFSATTVAQRTICEGGNYVVSSANATNFSSLNWSTSGDGTFISGAATLTPTYRPGTLDKANGSVILKLNAEKNTPCPADAEDSIQLVITKNPVITVVNSSLDICAGTAVPITGPGVYFGIQADNFDELRWTSSGNGVFTNSIPTNITTPNSYTPSAADIAAGSVILTLKASRTALNCNSLTTQAITLNFIKGPQIDAGPATATICENSNYTTSLATAIDYKNLTWSSNGTGTFLNNTSLKTAVYTPSLADIARGSITLTLTAIGNSCNAPSTDNIILSFHKLPQITVPNDTSICESSTSYAISGSNVIDGGALSWTSDGIGGRFSDATILNPTYFPSAQDVTRGFVNLTLTAAATAECSTPKSKSFKITFVKLPTVNAGPDMNTCDLSFTVLNATAANYSAIQWTANGTGSLEPSSIDKLEAIYNPLTAQTGSVNLTLTVTPLAACLSTGTISDVMQATFIAKPTVTTIPQADICADSPNTTIIGTTIANALSYEWTSTTGTTFVNKNVLEPVITPSPLDINNGYVVLKVTAKPNAPCIEDVSRNVRIDIKPLATVTVTNDLTVCMIDADNNGQLDPKTLSATFTNRDLTDPTSIFWEIISGKGSLENANTTTPLFKPAYDTDTVKIRVSVKNVAPCAGVEFKEFTLKAVQKPVVTLLKTTDRVCSTALTYNLTGNTVLDPTNRVEWTRVAPSGTGNFGNPTTANTTYTFSAADRANGSVKLRLTAYADPLCSSLSTSQEITIVIDKAPTAIINLSLPLAVCAGEIFTATAINPDGNTLVWTEINGNHGTFVNGTLDTATFNQSLNNNSNFEIQLTSNTTTACAPKVVSQIITVQPKPTIDAGASVQYNCSSKPFVISGVTGNNYDSVLWTIDGTNSSLGFSDKTALNPTFTPTITQINTGVIVLKITAKAKSPCGTTFDVSDTITLNFTPSQTVSFVAPTSICEGDTIALVGSAPNSASVAWSTSSTIATTDFSNSTALNTVYSPSLLDINLGKVTLTLTGVTNSNCPSATESIEVLIKKKPIADAGAPVSFCQGSGNYVVNDATAANYDASVTSNINWTLTGPATILSGTQNLLNPTIVPTPGASGPIVLTLTVTGYTECNTTAVSTKTITIVPPPVITIPSIKTICEGSTLTLTTADVSATNSSSISWAASLGTFSPINSLATIYTPAIGQTGLVNLNLTANGSGGCTSVTRSIALTIIPKPVVNAGVDGTICQSGTFGVSGASIQNAASYSWGVSGPATIQTGTENTLTPLIIPNNGASGNVTVSLTAVGVGTCPIPISDNLTVLINPAPVVNAGTDDKLCEGTSSYALNGSVSNAASGTTYTWTTDGSGTIQTTADPLKPIYIPGGNDFNSATGIKVLRFDLKATSTNGCAPVTDSMDLTVYAKPVVNAGLDRTDICEGTSVTLVGAAARNYSSITWSKSTGANGSFDFTSNVVNPTYTLGSADVSTVTLTMSALPNAACPQIAVTDAMTIYINKKPVITSTSDEITMCAETFTLPNLVTVTDANTILWTNTTGATGSPGTISNPTSLTPSFSPSLGEIANGFVKLKITATPKAGCSVTPEKEIKVFLTRKVTADAGNNREFCQGSPIIIDNGASTTASSYYWTENGTGTIKASTINTLHPEYIPGANETGIVTLTLHAVNPSPCTGEVLDTMTVTIKASPTVSAGPDFTICAGSNASLGNASTNYSDTIVWTRSTNNDGTSTSGYVGGTFIGTGINPTYVPSQDDINLGYVYLSVSASNTSCAGFVSDILKVTIAPGTSVSAGVNGTICEGANFNLALANSNATTVAWTSSQNSDGSSISTYQSGSFSTTTNAITNYAPSNDDVARGYVFLTITGTGNITCPVDKSTIRLDIIKKPTVSASDIQMCMNTTGGVVLNGSGANYTSLVWSKISGPASGYINNGRYFTGLPSSTPTNEVAKLRLVASPLSGCTVDAVKEITINIQALPTVEAGINGATCYIPGQPIAPFSIIGSSVTNAGSSTWTTSGVKSGKFNLGTPVIYESYSDNCVTETLTLTANGIGACSTVSVSDAVTLAVNCTPPSLGNIGGNATICQGTSSVVYTVAIDSNVQTYNWQVPTGATIFSGQGSNSITVNYGINAISGTVSVNGVNGCGSGISSTLLVTVNQRPTAAAISGSQIVCAGSTNTYTASAIANADSYEWTLPNGSIVSTTTNTLSIPFSLTATSGNLTVRGFNTTCGFGTTSANFAITVVPLPTLNSAAPADICSHSVFNYQPTSLTTGVTYTWTRAVQIGISNPAASGTGIINETLLNTTNALVPVIYTITTTTTSGCSKSEPVTVRVKPIPTLTSVAPVAAICSGSTFSYSPTSDASGAILWTRATVVGISEVGTSGSTTTNATISETLTNSTLSPIIVRYVLTLPAINGCTGPQKNIDVIVNPAPNVTPLSSQVLCEGDSLGINFISTNTGGTPSFDWTNTNGTIGLLTSGSGTIPTFTLLNPSTINQVATISVTPLFTNGGISCTGTPQSFNITVNPTADVNQPIDQVKCNGLATDAIVFSTTNTTGTTTYAWTNDNSSIGLGSTGNGSIASFTAVNTTSIPQVATIVVTPTYTSGGVSCVGLSKTFRITVNPSANVVQPISSVVCANSLVSSIFTTTNTIGTTSYAWTNDTTSIGLAASGSSSITPSFTAINSGAIPVVATINVTPTYTNAGLSCSGTIKTFTITVNPAAQINSVSDITKCKGDSVNAIVFSTANTIGSTTYSWTNSNPTIGIGASGAGDIPTFTTLNSGTSPLIATITVTPTFTYNGVSCTGPVEVFTITVNPVADMIQPVSKVVCNGETTSINFATSNTGTTTYNWSSDIAIGMPAITGTGSIANFAAINSGNAPIVATITVTPTYTNNGISCVGLPKTFTITVNPSADVIQPVTPLVLCNGTPTSVNFTTLNTGGITTYTWTNNTPSIGISSTGIGSIATFPVANLGTTPLTASLSVTPTFTNASKACSGATKTFSITINPTAQVNQPNSQVKCNGESTTPVAFSTQNTVGTTTYSWTNDTPGIGLNASGTGDIAAFSPVNSGTSPIVATIVVTPSYLNNGVVCTGPTKTFTITVNPVADVSQPTPLILCNGVQTSVNFATANTGGTTSYSWTNTTPSIGLAATGFGSIPNFTSVNTGTIPVVATVVVTPTFTNAGKSCTITGNTKTFSITVNPSAEVQQPASEVICNGSSTTAVNFTTSYTSGATTFAWTNSNTSIGLASSGTGSIPSFTGVNLGTTPQVATIVVTPTYTNAGVSCTGAPKSYTITVNPIAQVNQPTAQVICSGDTYSFNFTSANTGGSTTYSWTNNNTAIGLNLANGTGSIPSFTALNTGMAPTVATITVIPTYTNGGVSCVGLPKSFTITVNPIADVVQPNNQVVCNGASTAGITFSSLNGTGITTYSWTNSNTSIGLPVSGSGAVIPAFNAVNTGNIPVIATITVTPSYTNAGVVCTGPSKTFTITVNPSADLIQPTSQVICNGAATALVSFISNNLGGATTYSWINNNSTIGLASNGSGNILPFNAVNTGTTPVVATIVVTPTFTNVSQACAGLTKTFTITVNPSADVIQPTALALCNGDISNVINFNSLNSVGTTSYTWTNTNTSIGLGLNGAGTLPSFTAINTGTSPVSAAITVTPIYTNGGQNCSGTNKTFAITVNPSADFNQPASQELCSGATTAAVAFTTVNTGGTTTYSWTNSNTTIGLAASGSGPIPIFTAINSGATPQIATIIVTATYSNAGKSCSTSKTFTYKVHPIPKATISGLNNFTVCQNDASPSVTFTGSNGTAPYTFNYSIGTNNFVVSSPGTSSSATVTVPTLNNGIFVVRLISVQDASATACTSSTIISPSEAFVEVLEQGTIIPVASSTITQSPCQGSSIVPIVFTIGGSATNAYATNLPAGLTGVFDPGSSKFTISGSPTATGIFNYIIHTAGSTNGCNSTYGGTLTVKADDVITALTPTTTSQAVCALSPIQSISYNLGGGATGGDVTFSPHQPSGIVWSVASNILTITGTSSEVGVFTYTVQSYGICDQTTYSGTIEIKENATVSIISGNPNPTVCIGNSLGTALQYGITTSTSATMILSGILPTGVSFNAITGSFSGIPIQSGSFPYTISSSTGCGNILSGLITVNPTQSIVDVSGNTTQINLCVNSPIDPILFRVAPGVSGVTFTPPLPLGITSVLDANNIVTISGTPTAASTSTATYAITTQGSCGSVATATITFDIKPAATITFISGTSSLNQSICQNGPIVPIQFTIGGGATGIISPTLPTGLSWSKNLAGVYTISGNPTANGTFTIPITTTGCPITQTITITNINSVVSISLISATGTDNQTQCQSSSNSAIVPIKYATIGTTGITVAGLPTGVSSLFNPVNGELVISGTPTQAGIYNYTITTLPCNIVKTGVLKISTPISITNESVKNVTCSTASDGEISVTILGGVTSGGLYAVRWSGPNGFQQNLTHITGLAAGNYTLSGTDAVGCALPTKTYTVLPALPITISLVSTTNVTCNNALGCANFNFTGGTGIFTNFSLEYLDSSLQSWNPISNPTNNYFNICNLKAGLYRLAVTDSNNCTTEPYLFTIADYSTLKIADISLDNSLCANTPGKVRVTVTSLDNNLTFYYNSVLVPSKDLGNNVFELSISSPTTPAGIIKVTNSQNCWDSKTVTTSLIDPKISFTSLNLTTYGNISVNESIKFTNGLTNSTIPAEYDHIVWDFGDNSPLKVFYNPKDINPNNAGESITTVFHTYAIDGLYPVTLTVYNRFGCSRSITEIVTVGQGAGIMLPTAFSPNSDGINDLFRPSLLGLKEVSMYIYDNWGNLLYEITSDTASLPTDWGWNGIEKVNSEPKNGNYRYYIMAKTINNKTIEKEGRFMLIK
jgi:gliding motility-associated-like protein